MNLFDLSGKVALVTGSTKGIGEAIVHRMAEHGANVVVSSRKADACEKVAADINKAQGREAAVPIPCNINYKEQIAAAGGRRRARNGAASTCSSATRRSIPITGRRWEFPTRPSTRSWAPTSAPTTGSASMVLPEMVERKDGSIIIVSSIGGLRGSPVLGAYCISKAADLQLARNIAVEYGPHNVRANCIAPGLIKTDFARALWENPETLKRSTAGAPLRRIGEPDEIAGAAVFLASKAGSFTTGQVIVCDGGATIA